MFDAPIERFATCIRRFNQIVNGSGTCLGVFYAAPRRTSRRDPRHAIHQRLRRGKKRFITIKEPNRRPMRRHGEREAACLLLGSAIFNPKTSELSAATRERNEISSGFGETSRHVLQQEKELEEAEDV